MSTTIMLPQPPSPASMEEEVTNGIFQDHGSDGEGADEPNQQLSSPERPSPGNHRRRSPKATHSPDNGRNVHSPSYSSESRKHAGPGPSDSLMRTTQARECEKAAWGTHLEEKKVAASPPPIKKPDPNYIPGERLMKPTQSRIHERRQWEEYVKNKPFEDDIWWEKRKPAPCAIPSHKNAVQARFTEPTVAALHGKREKFPIKKEDRSNIESPSREHATSFAKIDVHSPLLKTTFAFNHQQVDKEGRLLYPKEENNNTAIHLEGKYSGPTVSSKLFYQTQSFEHSKWSLKLQEEKKPESPRNLDKLKPVSSRLLEFNTAMNAQRREKAVRVEPDSREIGWNQFHHKDKIPSELPTFTPMRTSPSNSPARRASGTHVFQKTQEHFEEGEYSRNYEEDHEYQEHYDEEYDQHFEEDEEEVQHEEHVQQEVEAQHHEEFHEEDDVGGEDHFQEVAPEVHHDEEEVEEENEAAVELRDADGHLGEAEDEIATSEPNHEEQGPEQ